jgi:hypothetical protein
MSAAVPGETRITRDDIERELRKLSGGVTDKVRSEKQKIVTGVVVAVAVVLVVTYVLGRRGGRKRTTVVEIRRL